MIDFAGLAQALLQRADTLVPQWLPGGAIRGHEYVCADLGGGKGSSLSVNLNTGMWADFGGDESMRGKDLTSLFAAIHGLDQATAARELMAVVGMRDDSVQAPARAADPATATPPAAKRKTMWRPIVPVPKEAPACDFWHWEYKDREATWAYEFEGVLYGHVARFRTSDGGKEVVPYTWCVDESDDRGTRRWHQKLWELPRPLYVPATLLSGEPSSVPVVLVEGEKCALAGHRLLGHEFDFVSWPGGGNAWDKAAWGWLLGRTVILWPDADAKRARLTPAERKAGVDPASKPLLPQAKQPGVKAMVAIGTVLQEDQGCTVSIIAVPRPAETPIDGWDIADAIESGWAAERVRDYIRGAHAFVAPQATAGAAAAPGKSTAFRAGAVDVEEDGPDLRWRSHLLTTQKGAPLAVRDNLVLALDGVPSGAIPGIAEVAGVIGFNEFTNDVVKLRAPPWGGAAGVWEEQDELEMGNWLTREHWLPSMTRGTLEEAVLMVSKRHRFHPIRDQLVMLRGKWDGEKRLATWLRKACMEEDELDAATSAYLARVGTWLLMGMCARVLPERKEGRRTVCGPGTKFDYMVIFEGAQGAKKSTLASVLGWEYSADTGLVLGDKDSYQNLQGIWIYEWGELDSLNRSEVTRVKNFVSSPKDRFRASFDRRPKDYPRQVVFIGTTNEDHYLSDTTGNRRFWPVRVTRQVDVAWVAQNLPQLLAEALAYIDAGERFWPTEKEQRELFSPQQDARTVDSSIDGEITRFLFDEDQPVQLGQSNLALVSEVTMTELLKRVGYTIDKQTAAVMRSACSVMRRLGWKDRKSSAPGRPRVYCRPRELPDALKPEPGASHGSTRPTQADSSAGGNDDPPF